LTSDPTLNPDATLLLGHTSVLTAHVLSPDGKRIITADRDEHIRVSRFPQSFVVERYLFGSQGFVSALHIPKIKQGVLISGGGEDKLRIWDWREGKLLGSVGIWEAVLPHRRVRCGMRKVRTTKDGAKRRKVEVDEEEVRQNVAKSSEAGSRDVKDDVDQGTDPDQAGFYDAPEGWFLPTGQGVCIRKIDSLVINGQTIILFYSEG
jgi:tRNA (guanine-N(7)-)-methyltransferase subunit TRM82